MQKKMTLPVLALAAVALPCAPRADELASQADPPADVLALIYHNKGCNLATNHPADTAAQREAERLNYKCDSIATDFATLHQKYQNDPDVLRALDFEILPADVDALIIRHGICNADAADADNASAARRDAARLYYKCNAMADDEAALRQKYQSDPRILKVLDGSILPADVDDLIHRNRNCNSAASHTDNASAARRDAARLTLKCDAMADDEAALRQKYQSDPRILKALDGSILPADADGLIDRRMHCDRMKDEAARLTLKCDSVGKDEDTLRRKYSYDARVLKALNGKRVIFSRRVPIRIAPYTGPAGSSKKRP
ncbi:MAG: hypothetical protein ACREDT_11130 [Methylocella sp.]